LTNWGFNLVSPNPKVARGGLIYKLFMTAFPGYYRGNSVYAMFPLTVPEQNREIFTSLGTEKEYDFSRPTFVGPPIPIMTWSGVVSVLNNQIQFKVPCKW